MVDGSQWLPGVPFDESDQIFCDAHIVEIRNFDQMFFDLWGEFDCEGGCAGGFATWPVHLGFLVSLSARWRLASVKMRSISTSIFFTGFF